MTAAERQTAARCARAGIALGRAIRRAVHELPLRTRGAADTSLLKSRNVRADAVGERIGLRYLEQLSRRLGHRIELLLDPHTGRAHSMGNSRSAEVIWAALDAVDGTVKVAGLGNALPRVLRAANDGMWATGAAFTRPTRKSFAELRVGDFEICTIVDGNPSRYRTYPSQICTRLLAGGLATYEIHGNRPQRLFTSSARRLRDSFVFLDNFQAYDVDTHRRGDPRFAVELYRRFIDRHHGGAYDVVRLFGTLSALQRSFFGWHRGRCWYEPQCAAFVIVNENLFNLLPAVALVEGAGGVAVDFSGRRLRERRVADGRTDVIYAANRSVGDAVLRHAQSAQHLSRRARRRRA